MARDALTVRQRALNYLARREYTRDELYRKLMPYTEESDSLEDLLADFKARGWLSEQRFVEQVVHARSGRYGSRYIAHELREKGVAEELIAQALPQLRETIWKPPARSGRKNSVSCRRMRRNVRNRCVFCKAGVRPGCNRQAAEWQ